MDILRMQALTRKLEYTTDALKNHECEGKNCQRCQNAYNALEEVLIHTPKLLRVILLVVGVVYIVVRFLYNFIINMWRKLFHKQK